MPNLAIDTSSPIRRFLDQDIKKDLADALGYLPEDHKIAVIGVADLESKEAQGFVVYRPNQEWTVVGEINKKFASPLGARVSVMWSK